MAVKKKPKSAGRKVERLKLEGDWQANLKRALGVPRPPEGFPKTNPDKVKKPK